LFKNVKVCQ